MRSGVISVSLLTLVVAAAVSGAQSPSSNAPPSEIAGKSLKQYLQDMKSRDASVRQNAISLVIHFGKNGRDAVPTLIDIIRRDPDASCRVHACMSLSPYIADLTPMEVESAVSALTVRLNEDPQGIVRYYAAGTLSQFRMDAKPAIPTMIAKLRDPSTWEIRRAVVGALAAAGGDNKNGPDSRALHAICNLFLNDPGEPTAAVRIEAAIALGAMGRPQIQDQARAIQALQRALKDPDKNVVIWAHVSLMAIDKPTEEGLSALAKFLKSKDSAHKIQAARALAAMGREARTKVPNLVEMLSDPDPFAVASAIWSLGEIGITASSAIPQLKTIADKKDQNEFIKELAKEAVQKLSGQPVKKP